MNLYLLSQESNTGYDTYDSCVVAAETPEDAVLIYPGGYKPEGWPNTISSYSPWVLPNHVTCEYIGVAKDRTLPGVILASFNAG